MQLKEKLGQDGFLELLSILGLSRETTTTAAAAATAAARGAAERRRRSGRDCGGGVAAAAMAASVQCMYCRIVVGSKKSRKKGCSCTQFYPPKPYRGGFLKRGAVVVSDERRRRGHGEPTSIFSIFKTNTELAEKI